MKEKIPTDEFSAACIYCCACGLWSRPPGQSEIEAGFAKEIEEDMKRADLLRANLNTTDSPGYELEASAEIIQECLQTIFKYATEDDQSELSKAYPALGAFYANQAQLIAELDHGKVDW